MSSGFLTRISGKSWRVSGSEFEWAMKGAIPYLEKSCPDVAEYPFKQEWIYQNSGLGFSASSMTVDEEKHVLEALKLSYPDWEKKIAQLPDDSDQKKYLLEFLSRFRELIAMIEEEVRDIERGRLIIQEDGSAIVNENFKEE